MWQILKFQERYKNKRLIGEQQAKRIIQELTKRVMAMQPNVKTVFTQIISPAESFSSHDGNHNEHLMGIIFVEYDERLHPFVLQAITDIRLDLRIFVGFQSISEAQIHKIQNAITDHGKEQKQSLNVDDEVLIKSGIYKNMTGYVYKVNNEEKTLSVIVVMLGQESMLHNIAFEDVEKPHM